MRNAAAVLIAAAAFLEAAAQQPRAVPLPASKFGAAPLQARFDKSGRRVVVDTLVGSCEFDFDALFANPNGTIPCPSAGGGLQVVGSPTGSAVVGLREGKLIAFRRADGVLREVPLPTLPKIGAVVPVGTKSKRPRVFLREGPPDHDTTDRPVAWRFAEAERPEAGARYELRRAPVVSEDERTVALVRESDVVALEEDGMSVRFSLPGRYSYAALSGDGRVLVAWTDDTATRLTVAGSSRPTCTAATGGGVRFVVPSPSGSRILVVGDYTAATLLDGTNCAVLKTDAFEAQPLNFISSAVVDDKGGMVGVILEVVLDGFKTKTRLVRFPHKGRPWALEIPLPLGGASATRPAVAVGRDGRFLVHSLKGVALVRGRP